MDKQIYPLSIRDISPDEGFTRLTGIRSDNLPDGVHTGGAWLSPDDKEVWKPLDGRPYLNADCHVETQELEVLEAMAGLPGFPRNWRVEERNGRRFLVRPKSIILTPEQIKAEYAKMIEQAIRQLNSQFWVIGDLISVGFDRASLSPFIVDLSAAHKEEKPWPADEEWRILAWLKWAGFKGLAKLREMARSVAHPETSLLVKLGAVDDLEWPGEEWQHVYASRMRPISTLWANIPQAHYVSSSWSETGVHTWVITPGPLAEDVIYRYELTWGWSPISYIN